mmetsp:Transcript_95818/g.299325  ORF Transcript_95818/g.299325 Transcript_95818/m.299325 type:complete len:298 (+) Transcript_95818:314-1207(+)
MAEPKKSGPFRTYVRSWGLSLSSPASTRTSVADVHAKPRPQRMTPQTTATQRSCHTVTTVTRTTTIASIQLIRRMRVIELQANVFRAMSVIRPTRAATGMIFITGASKSTLRPRVMPMTVPETRLRPPLPTLRRDWAMSAQPPCVPKSEAMMLPTPWPKHSRLMEPLVPVIWSMSACVIRLSSRPTMAKRTAVEMTLPHIELLCQSTPEGGKSHEGMVLKPPRKVDSPATSPSVLRGRKPWKAMLKTVVRMTEARGGGRTLPATGILAQTTAEAMAKRAVMVMLAMSSLSTQGPSPW